MNEEISMSITVVTLCHGPKTPSPAFLSLKLCGTPEKKKSGTAISKSSDCTLCKILIKVFYNLWEAFLFFFFNLLDMRDTFCHTSVNYAGAAPGGREPGHRVPCVSSGGSEPAAAARRSRRAWFPLRRWLPRAAPASQNSSR